MINIENDTNSTGLQPSFNYGQYNIGSLEITREVNALINGFKSVPHSEILPKLLEQIEPIDFREKAGLSQSEEKLQKKHYLICCIEEIIRVANCNAWGLGRYLSFIYVFNGSYWSLLTDSELEDFLGQAAFKMGVDKFESQYFRFREELYKQFLAMSNLAVISSKEDEVLINLLNGTFHISPKEQKLLPHRQSDFLKYQLPFTYNENAKAQLFQAYLDKVQPDRERQKILAEYIGYLFITPTTLKLEKTLLLYGTGANGKSVFFEVVNALLGPNNISSFSLQSLTNENGYSRAKLANKLLNYATEINGSLEAAVFKQLVSGEPVEARLPYGEPFTMTNYGKLIFNCNELPKEVEYSHAYYRRFLIIPFEVTIPENEQDKQLSTKIISKELPGVFNWVLDGLKRLLEQSGFSHSQIVEDQIELYKAQSDNVLAFFEDQCIQADAEGFMLLKDLYGEYRRYCIDDGYKPLSKGNFKRRLENKGIVFSRKNIGIVAGVVKNGSK